MIKNKSEKDCCGCYACANICPNHCIEMKVHQEGFWYPQIDESKCTNCNLCEKVCPEINKYTNTASRIQPQVLGAWNLDEKIRKQSSSGGVFTALAEWILNQNGIVFGSGFDETLKVVHKKVATVEALAELRGSKYIQSNIRNTYKEAKECLMQGKKVLFTGTPCQIAGLYSYLQKDYKNLYTCDLVCHGVSSPKVFDKYKEYLERKNNSKVKKISFRDKEYGWKVFSMALDFEDDSRYIKTLREDPFMIGFLKDKYLRPSCHECTFSTLPRVADISLADYWGVSGKYPKLDDDKGTSLLLVNTDKGQKILTSCKEQLFMQECDFAHALQHNPCIAGSVKPHSEREQFFKDLDSMPFEGLIKRYMSPPSWIKRKISGVRSILGIIKTRLLK
ncbi:MAG: Coenzyme F420 hydrogenase/dehydrogenase, beta subunit C-terminal domain [Cellulosilyticaceae bacterium]